MRKLFTLLCILLISAHLIAQRNKMQLKSLSNNYENEDVKKNSIQIKLISTQDFNPEDIYGFYPPHEVTIFDYSFGIYYQRLLKNKFHVILGGTYNMHNKFELKKECKNCVLPVSPLSGYGFQNEVGIRYYLKEKKDFKIITEIGFTTYFFNSIGEYRIEYFDDTFKFSIFNTCFGPYLKSGLEYNLSNKIFFTSLIYFGFYKRDYKSYNEGHINLYDKKTIYEESNWNKHLNFELRLGYRF
ncbi:MAG: hypothetical protein KA275_06035 [Chitinophagaceae bacterium]|nr:hypothetical protein [Chitinophagaceae bacterium]